MYTKSIFSLSIITWVFTISLFGQSEKDMLKALMDEDRSVVETIVLYPEDIRNNIFEVSLHPEILVRLSGMQENSKEYFKNLVASYSQQQQAQFYELTRYHGLTRDLAEGGQKSKSEINVILTNYPEDIHDTALDLGRKEYETLSQIYHYNKFIKNSFDDLMKRYEPKTQRAVQALIKTPEILTLMADNIDLTILVGDVYKNDPAWIQEKAKTLQLEVANRQAEELEDYKKQLEEDPEAYEEMLNAADLYAKDNNVSTQQQPETTVKVTYSYNYWYGYPYWYTYPFWRPVPYYYHTGFYISPAGAVIIIGLPSFHYVHWHFTYYPHMHVHLHGHYHRHYRRHPHSHGGFHAAVDINVNKNVNIRAKRNPDRPNRPSKRQTTTSRSKMSNKKLDNRDFNRFRATDNHTGNWTKNKKGGFNRGKRS